MNFFDSSAADAVITLNVEPGTYSPALARFRSGAAGSTVRLDPGDLRKVGFDQVRVEAGRRRHHADLPGPRIERDHGTALCPELVERNLLCIQVEVRHDVRALDGRAAELVERLVDERGEARVRGGQVVVQRPLEPRARSSDGAVPDEMRRQLAVGVTAEEERSSLDLSLAVPCEPLSGLPREDEPAVDGELGDALDRVVLAVGKPCGGPCLPVRRHDDEDADEGECDVREPDDLAVHGCELARLETSSKPASRRKFATMLVPP